MGDMADFLEKNRYFDKLLEYYEQNKYCGETMSTELMNFNDMQKAAEMLVKSQLFPAIKNVPQALTLMMLCQAENIPAVKAVQRYDIINGRPALKTDVQLAEFQRRGGKVKWLKYTDTEVSAEFFAPGVVGSLLVPWNMDRAKKAGLTGKDNWHKYPRAMLRARVVSEGIRATMPEVNAGIYTPEEVEDFTEPQKSYQPSREALPQTAIYEAEYESHMNSIVNEEPVKEKITKIKADEPMIKAAIEEIMVAKTLDDLKDVSTIIKLWDDESKTRIRPDFEKKWRRFKDEEKIIQVETNPDHL